MAVVATTATACAAPDERTPPGYEDVEAASVVAIGDDAFHVVPPYTAGEVVAYVSRAEQRIYVSLEMRDRVQNLFNAHISVSTGHWRIPLPGDSPTEPLTPGAPEREFEERRIEEWDPEMQPSPGDFRIVRGSYVPVHLSVECGDVDGTGVRVAGGPWNLAVADGEVAGTVRENFEDMGGIQLFAADDATCSTPIGTRRALMWANPAA